ncbi:TadE family protein [Streptomyces sp. NBC_01716]|uniref:TadE family protein n=1 Tax=Streptomyces sp. NBC_01716 TaxID=2975917 RepID=UPI002E352733|nr:TadE family protein [Streptomyces sp. NBC_01716]
MPKRHLLRKTGNETGEKGQAAIEFAGLVTLMIFVGLAAVQLGLVAYAVQQAGTASRASARAASTLDTDYAQVGRDSMSDWLAEDATFERKPALGDEVKITARVPVPAILPVFDFGDAERTATMPLD